jgi:phosphatidylserine/phosphatidylglycerophosphate/cardiolipin synthase-like enzyme
VADLWQTIGEVAIALHEDRVASIADAISRLAGPGDLGKTTSAFGPSTDPALVGRLESAWMASPGVGAAEVAAALRAASRTSRLIASSGSVELVWTGPKTGLIPTRHTEQVILEVIEAAVSDLFVVSYVFYKAGLIVAALEAAIDRGVVVRILLESSTEQGGAVRGDAVRAMREAVPRATILVWEPATRNIRDGLSACVHAKCAVADRRLAFITSANLTPAALERNMELGLLIRGGSVPERLRAHLDALVATKVIVEATR